MKVTITPRVIVLWICLSNLVGCATAPVLPPVSELPRQVPQSRLLHKDRPVIAFVLGSGAARGFAHVGVLKTLEEQGIDADIVVGSSAGSVVGALYAGGIRGQALVEAANKLEIQQLTDWAIPDRGVVKGELLQDYVNRLLRGRPIQALDTQFAAVATDLAAAKLAVFNFGDTGMAVRASSTIPGLVQPVRIAGRDYVDGGLISQLPAKVARQLGAEVVIAVDISRAPIPQEELQSMVAVMRQTFIIMTNRIAEAEYTDADIIIRPDVGNMSINEFDSRGQAIAAGEAAALLVIGDIKRLIANKVSIKALQPPKEERNR